MEHDEVKQTKALIDKWVTLVRRLDCIQAESHESLPTPYGMSGVVGTAGSSQVSECTVQNGGTHRPISKSTHLSEQIRNAQVLYSGVARVVGEL